MISLRVEVHLWGRNSFENVIRLKGDPDHIFKGKHKKGIPSSRHQSLTNLRGKQMAEDDIYKSKQKYESILKSFSISNNDRTPI